MVFPLPSAWATLWLLCCGAPAGPDAPGPGFEDTVRPLLQSKCVRCHGPKSRKADLDLSSSTGILRGGESGPVLTPGNPEKSSLFEKVHKGEMPPAKKDALSHPETETLRAWIAAGAKLPSAGTVHALTQHDVIPILLRHCAPCHGRYKQEAGLDLRTTGGLLKGGKSGPAMIPGKPDQSLAIKRITAGQMPPAPKLVDACVKPVEPQELEALKNWIAAGGPVVDLQPDVATTTPDTLVTDKDRDFWAFKTPRLPPVPKIKNQAKYPNPVDAFILPDLEVKGLTLSHEADRLTLLRRATLDLTGLLPTPDEIKAFLADNDPNAYEKVLDRLLASPRYGERWGRYWLDLAGYADSEGKREQDLPRPHAWRYRDYVIRAFNADKPYSQFLLEQLAGDELVDYEKAKEITPEIYDNLVATGFLRMTPDATWANITGFVPDRIEVIADQMDVLGSSVFGLTLKCARCHSHKFDPIPQRDYFRLVAVFKGALDEYDWLKPEIKPGIGPESVDVAPPRQLHQVTTAERKEWEKKKEGPEPKIHALWDRGEPSPTYLYRRGEYMRPAQLIGPGVPSVLTDGKTPFEWSPPWPGAKQTGRRLAFAKWAVRSDNPLTARVMANRIWKHHFGVGLVPSLANFGKTGDLPTHPDLLDWLAVVFAKPRERSGLGWSIKSMHKLLMTSATYRQGSAVSDDLAKRDPDNRLYSRAPLQRLDAESLYDVLLQVAGKLDTTPGGPADPVQARPDGLVTPAGNAKGWRRLVYVQQTRKQPATHAEVFDFPQMNPNCVQRRDSTVATQALHLMNNGMVRQLSADFAMKIAKSTTEPASQVEAVYLAALSRSPTKKEVELGQTFLRDAVASWRQAESGAGKNPVETPEAKALASYCHAILNSAGFLFVD